LRALNQKIKQRQSIWLAIIYFNWVHHGQWYVVVQSAWLF